MRFVCALTISIVAWNSANAQSLAPESGLTLSAAIAQTLQLDPQIARARWALEESRGSLMRAQSAFDLTFATSAVRQDAGTASLYTVGFGQRLRGGIIVTPQVTLERSQLQAAGLSSTQHAAAMGMDVTVPLLRGRGGGVLAAGEEAALLSREASGFTLEHQRSLSVLGVVQSYWNYVAAARRVEVMRDAETRAQRLLDETQKLIAADERPAADEVRVRANYASKRASRVAAEGGLNDARADLASAMGISPEAMLALPLPNTALPDIADRSSLPSTAAASELALARRRDLVAARNQSSAVAALLSGARSDARPRFDLAIGVDYSGAAHSPVDAFGAGQGVRSTVGVSFGLPLQNRDASGLQLLQQARLQQSQIAQNELARQISIDAAAAANRLDAAAVQLTLAHEAAALYAKDVKSEVVRFRLGVATMFDLFFSQDALTGASLSELEAQLNYARALARLRFETATIFEDIDEAAAVNVDALLSWSTPSEPAKE